MGTTFALCRMGEDGTLQEDENLPAVQAVFSFWDYPRFIRRLALDAGLRQVWEDHEKATDEVCNFVYGRLPEVDLHRKRQKSKKRKKGRRTRIKNWGQGERKQSKAVEVAAPRDEEQKTPDDERLLLLKQRLADTKEAFLAMAHSEPLVEFIMVADDGILDSDACERIRPRLRAVAENWEPTKKGWFGWREMALEICGAMDYAAEHPDIVFVISE